MVYEEEDLLDVKSVRLLERSVFQFLTGFDLLESTRSPGRLVTIVVFIVVRFPKITRQITRYQEPPKIGRPSTIRSIVAF